jgi:hypothetical protein
MADYVIYAGVHYPVELVQCFRIGKDFLAELFAVYFFVASHYGFAESINYFHVGLCLGLEEFVTNLIGINDHSAEFGKRLGYFCLAGSQVAS